MGLFVSAIEEGRIDPRSFPGIQEGERVLYMFRSHWLREVFAGIATIILVALAVVASIVVSARYFPLSVERLLQVQIGFAIAGVLFLLWFRFLCEHSRSYITDRRFVRFEGAILPWQSRRVLFWKDATKTRSFSKGVVQRMFQVGTLEVIPNFAVESQNIIIPYTYYFSDLASYIDKIIYTYNTKREEIASIRDFVEKPRGKRYPVESRSKR